MEIKHAKTSTIPDSDDTSLVRPSDWNAAHNLTTAASGVVVGRRTAGAGAAEEITYAQLQESLGLSSTDSPTHAGLTLTGLTGYLSGNGASALTASATIPKADVGLGNVENTALSTWAGSTNITTLGTVVTGVWSGTAIGVTKGGTGLTVGTSGGVPYFSSTTAIASSAALGSTQVVLGGGAGAAPNTNASLNFSATGPTLHIGDKTTTYAGYNGLILGGSASRSVLDFWDNGARVGEFYTDGSGFNFFTDVGKTLNFYVNNSFTTPAISAQTNGNVGIQKTIALAYLHIGAGTATASTAPLKFTSGTNLTTAEAGAMEYNGTNLFFTRSGTTRESVICSNAVNTVTATLPNRTITVVIAGTTYYIHAKTTND